MSTLCRYRPTLFLARVHSLACGYSGIKEGSTYNYPSGNVDLTPTLLTLAAGAAYVPEFMDGKSLTAFLTPNLEADAAAKVAGWRKAFLNEYGLCLCLRDYLDCVCERVSLTTAFLVDEMLADT